MHHPLKPRVLCIDDEPTVGELIRSLLERTGDFNVAVETKSLAALHRARTFRPDLVFMDIKMPGPDGFAVARYLRDEPGLRHRPILFYTGLPDMEESVKRLGRTGPTEFLGKGVSASVVEQTVRRILAERLKIYEESKAAQPQ